jgi:GNAT superfamily N-acetyltransferase
MNNVHKEPVRVTKADAERAADAMAKAFQDYVMFRYFYPDGEVRRKFVFPLLASAVYYGIRYGEVYAPSPAFEGAAVWVPSENCPLTFGRLFRSIPLKIIWRLVRNASAPMKEPNDYIDAVHARLVPFKHMYLQSIGVNPLYQGQGCSGRLIRPMLARLDAEKMPCYLETLEKKNVSIYEHMGFTLIDESPIPGTDLWCYAMLRDNRQ